MKLNRVLQHELLLGLADVYPEPITHELWDALTEKYGADVFHANARYLDGHGLVNRTVSAIGTFIVITPEGLDFLVDDGGLSAILNTVTVKLHEDTARSEDRDI